MAAFCTCGRGFYTSAIQNLVGNGIFSKLLPLVLASNELRLLYMFKLTSIKSLLDGK